MANTDKQNFRCDTVTRWRPAMEKIADMREAGYGIDMTRVLGGVVDFVRDSDPQRVAEFCETLGIDVAPKAAA